MTEEQAAEMLILLRQVNQVGIEILKALQIANNPLMRVMPSRQPALDAISRTYAPGPAGRMEPI